MAVSLHKYHNQALSDMMRRFKEQNPVSLHKQVQVAQDTAIGWAVHVSPLADNAWKNVVLFYYGNGKYNRRWTSAPTGDAMWSLYCSYEEDKNTPVFNPATATYDVVAVFYAKQDFFGKRTRKIASITLTSVVGALEAEAKVEAMNGGVTTDEEYAFIERTKDTLRTLYSEFYMAIQKELVQD